MASESSRKDFSDAAEAKAWLDSQVFPRLEAMHSCYIERLGSAALNMNVERLTGTYVVDESRQLDLIRQDIGVIRDWALRNHLPNVPPLPPPLRDREEAQSAFSEWCAYVDRQRDRAPFGFPTGG